MPTENRSSNTEQMVSVPLRLNEQQARDVQRFYDTCEDGQDYDVLKDRMKALARIGLVRSLGFGRYELTDVGCAAVNGLRDKVDQPAAQHQGEPVALQHMAVSEGGVLRWMTGRKMQDCELYAMPDGSAIRAKLYTHADAGEVERLEAELAKLRKLHDSAVTQMAERDALLREVVALDPRGEFMGWDLDARIDAALSASAEPSAPNKPCNHAYRLGECTKCGRISATE
ncbi:hypothetical protein [Pseudomonas vranovensis]|uniref:hypothetical protein n=1 Tax=Pseudomonas vranovensis TaxID=321661 RepID=UPI003D95E2E7